MFDAEGVCNTCRNLEIKQQKIDWDARLKQFEEIINQYRGKYQYDCIVPFSGGKDSTYTVWALVKKFGLKPLVVRYNHHMIRPQTLRNQEMTIKQLKLDFLEYRTDWDLVKKLMRVSLDRKGDIYWYQHTGIFCFPMHMAIKFNVPLIIWGEPTAEYAAYYRYDEEEIGDEERFNYFINLGITAQDMIGFLNDPTVKLADLWAHQFPARKDLQAIECRSICLGTYTPWDVKAQAKIIQDELGWKGDMVEGVPPEYNYEKIEDMLQGVQDYLKYIKRGYGRMSHLASIDIRNGRLTREKAMQMVEQWEGRRPGSLDALLKWLNLSEVEFYEIANRHRVSPWKHDSSQTKRGESLPDQKDWVI